METENNFNKGQEAEKNLDGNNVRIGESTQDLFADCETLPLKEFAERASRRTQARRLELGLIDYIPSKKNCDKPATI